MGKKIPLRIGRKSKRELNPVEKLRRSEKQKKNLKQFVNKMHQKANGEFESKVKRRRSPSPESNDPMVGTLISSSSLRNPIYDESPEVSLLMPVVPEKLVKKALPSSFAPLSLYKKKEEMGEEYSEDSSEESAEYPMIVKAPLKTSLSQNQTLYKTLLGSDSTLSDFFTSINHLM